MISYNTNQLIYSIKSYKRNHLKIYAMKRTGSMEQKDDIVTLKICKIICIRQKQIFVHAHIHMRTHTNRCAILLL